jgi:hypothetical protein
MALEELYAWLTNCDQSVFHFFPQIGGQTVSTDVDEFERFLGHKLPAEYREFAVHPLGCFYIEVDERYWPRPSTEDAGPMWRFLYGLKVYGCSCHCPSWMLAYNASSEMRQLGYGQFVPFLRVNNDTDVFCFTQDQEIVLFQPDEINPVPLTFSECVLHELQQLEQRTQRIALAE